MAIRTEQAAEGIAEVVMDHPPVNALDVAAWFELADALLAAGRVPTNRSWCCAPRAAASAQGSTSRDPGEGRRGLVGVNRGCAAAFAAVYDCEVPVIAAVNGFCLGGGIGLVGNADIIVAADDATFGLPEVDRGALGAATHLAAWSPARAAPARLHGTGHPRRRARTYGSLAAVVPPPSCAPPHSASPRSSPGRARRSCGGPRSRSTASTRST